MTYKFSLVLNTRHRTGSLANLLSTLYRTTRDLSQIELVIGIDNDDDETLQHIIKYHRKLFKLPRVEYILCDQPVNLNKAINNLAQHTLGKYIWCLNDDVEFHTYGWDRILWDFLEKNEQEDGILYCGVLEKGRDELPAFFPILGGDVFHATGKVLPDQLASQGADLILHRIFNREFKSRILYCKDVLISHNQVDDTVHRRSAWLNEVHGRTCSGTDVMVEWVEPIKEWMEMYAELSVC